ncbi:MAG: hypothetical protein IKH19_05345 [Muribaculaceae bacterium]|nr:hypothetical protein [Muribaculaceae bacterium]
MRLRGTYFLAAAFLLVLALSGCDKSGGEGVANPQPSVYYWRTVFALDSAERQFLSDHAIKKMYVRYFDVVMRGGRPMPNATLRFADTLPAGVEVIPTIFVMENCLRHGMDSVAPLLVDRVLQMCETCDVTGVREIQIDCDWTRTSQDAYFSFLRLVREHLAQRGMRLSATIRLHQLRMAPPPVDEGVLMVYNTGDVRRRNGRNPILDPRDVQPYLNDLASYQLPLCAAYPAFRWQLLYGHDGKFKAILYDENLADTTMYRRVADDRYNVIFGRDIPEMNSDASSSTWISVGDTVVVMLPSAHAVGLVHDALGAKRPSINRQVVLYSLDSKNLKYYNTKEYEKVFSN